MGSPLNIILVGAGQIGSRHLQALTLLKTNAQIDVVDPSRESLDTTRQRFEEAQKNSKARHEVRYSTEISSQLKKSYDFGIIATSSAVRRNSVDQLLKVSTVKNLI